MAWRETGPNKISSIQFLCYNTINEYGPHKNIWLPRLATFSFPWVNIIVNEPFGVTLSWTVIIPQHVSSSEGLLLVTSSTSIPLIGWYPWPLIVLTSYQSSLSPLVWNCSQFNSRRDSFTGYWGSHGTRALPQAWANLRWLHIVRIYLSLSSVGLLLVETTFSVSWLAKPVKSDSPWLLCCQF